MCSILYDEEDEPDLPVTIDESSFRAPRTSGMRPQTIAQVPIKFAFIFKIVL